MVEYWPSTHKTLGSIPTALKGKSIKCVKDLFRVRYSGAWSLTLAFVRVIQESGVLGQPGHHKPFSKQGEKKKRN